MTSWGTIGNGLRPDRGVKRPARLIDRDQEFFVRPEWAAAIAPAIGHIPCVHAIMTSAHELRRGGVLVQRLMMCADVPLCVAVSVPTGQRVAMLIRDSRTFAINLLQPTSKLILRKFAADEDGDPFEMFQTSTMATGAPLLSIAAAAIECVVIRHLDIESDHELYIGRVISGRVNSGQEMSGVVNTPPTPPSPHTPNVPGRDVPCSRPRSSRLGEDDRASGRADAAR